MQALEDSSSHLHGLDRKNASWSDAIAEYKRSNPLKSSWQITNSLLPFCGLWYLMYLSLSWSYWLTLLLAIPTAGFLVRIFIIQHDCGHHSFFRSRRANDLLGGCCGLFTLTPYYLWRRSHSRHHASSGDLSHRGHGDVWVLTVDEYRSSLISWPAAISVVSPSTFHVFTWPSTLIHPPPTLYLPHSAHLAPRTQERAPDEPRNPGNARGGLVHDWAADVLAGSSSCRDAWCGDR